MSLIVTGTIGIDTVETPTAAVEGVLGGSSAYFAAAASLLTPVRLVAAVGGDWPAEHRQALENFDGISLDGLEMRPDSPTFAWGGKYLGGMNERETLFTKLGVLEQPGPAVPEGYRDSTFVFLANTHPAEQLRLLAQFPERQLAFADTMNFWIDTALPDLQQLLGKIDGVVINDEEAEMLTGIPNAISAGKQILEMGPHFVLVKKGAHGCVLVGEDRVAVLPAYPAEAAQVVDPTGAGDSFAGGLMGYLAAHDAVDFAAVQTALAWGTMTASFTIESFSLDRLMRLTKAELEGRLEAFRHLARVG